MAEIIVLETYRTRHARSEPATAAAVPTAEAPDDAPDLARACRNMTAGLRQMQEASSLLRAATNDLRDLANEMTV